MISAWSMLNFYSTSHEKIATELRISKIVKILTSSKRLTDGVEWEYWNNTWNAYPCQITHVELKSFNRDTVLRTIGRIIWSVIWRRFIAYRIWTRSWLRIHISISGSSTSNNIIIQIYCFTSKFLNNTTLLNGFQI